MALLYSCESLAFACIRDSRLAPGGKRCCTEVKLMLSPGLLESLKVIWLL